jgi:pyruvate/2-oxoglutarate dehydrogenase complex dihydrolipoamide acyltransferase (E2) component|tara:strand:- start:433 stop:777 length:345 start_codon:yes stop_codon:yes gene_type:complete
VQAVNQSVADLAGRARQGKLAPEEYNGGSFTISNLGMFGISEFTAVINPPQACILAVGGGSPTATVGSTASELEKDTIMTVVLSADRRVVDDHIAAQFLQVFRTYCEKPSLMAV